MARKRAENREGSLGFPGFVKPVFTKDSKPLGKGKRSLGYLGSVKPGCSPKEGAFKNQPVSWVSMTNAKTSQFDISPSHWQKDPMTVSPPGTFITG
ncbi:hypothetical protein TNCV_4137371 [Trichonephila clavipes]|nr:hypothetical protein TNCV_4137371 [Trichonephila clavipes]